MHPPAFVIDLRTPNAAVKSRHAYINGHFCGSGNSTQENPEMGSGVGNDGQIPGSDRFPLLRRLFLGGNGIKSRRVGGLAESRFAASVCDLSRQGNPAIDDEGATALAESRFIRNLVDLDLAGSEGRSSRGSHSETLSEHAASRPIRFSSPAERSATTFLARVTLPRVWVR
jgi:hypothetical protein